MLFQIKTSFYLSVKNSLSNEYMKSMYPCIQEIDIYESNERTTFEENIRLKCITRTLVSHLKRYSLLKKRESFLKKRKSSKLEGFSPKKRENFKK